nr:MAG TPA: hypothetical protein [Inoviridae sp.]
MFEKIGRIKIIYFYENYRSIIKEQLFFKFYL